ncbi:MAG: DUF2244 domain-containing protein [Lysobacterales bacterium]|jgi:uncharacterized membrane protein
MVVTWKCPEQSLERIVARGNFSLGAGGLVGLLVALGAVTLLLAGVLAWQGFWPVLLIAVIQIVLVTRILIKAWERAWVSEQIEVGPDRILVTTQKHKNKKRIELETAWAVVEMLQPEVAWYAPRLQLRSGSRKLELGAFLTVEEKRQLADCLKSAIRKHSALEGASNF